MKYLYATIAFLVFFLAPRCASAADYSVKFGPGIEGQELTGATKMFGVRRDEHMMHGVYNALELGGYSDAFHRRSGAGVVKAQIGVKPGPAIGVYGFGFFGPCGITATDTQLSTHLQFATDIGVGVRDSDTFMTFGYSHISNAGIRLPNKGRDYLMFSVGVSL